jgi:hypothetical protein
MTSLSAAGVHLGATRTASRPEGPITPLIWMMTTNNDCFPMLLARTLYQGSADSHSGISNGGSARDCYETLCSDPAHRWCNFRVADYSGVASVCATTRESQVSYQSISQQMERATQSNYRSEMPIAAFSSRDPSQYSYFSATLKSCCISSGVGGAAGLFGSNGRASSRKKL